MKIYLYHLIFTSKILKGVFQTGTMGCASFIAPSQKQDFCDNLEDGKRKLKWLIQKD